jgi:hypothetical protein
VSRKKTSENKYMSPHKRPEPRVQGLRQITICYEGYNEEIRVKPPDLSIHGMFISTNRDFAEGTVLNLRFQLAHSGVEIDARAEVRYCLPGVGVGVEFIRISREAEQEIVREIESQTNSRDVRTGYSNGAGTTSRGIARKLRRPRLRRIAKR